MSPRRHRFSHAIGAVALAIALQSSVAAASDITSLAPTYDTNINVGVFVGCAFGSGFTFAYGVDVRWFQRPTIFLRLEGRGLRQMVVSAGVLAGAPLSVGELGWSFLTGAESRGLGFSSGLHLAAGFGSLGIHSLVQGMIPLVGDRKNYDISFGTMIVAPQFSTDLNSLFPSPVPVASRHFIAG